MICIDITLRGKDKEHIDSPINLNIKGVDEPKRCEISGIDNPINYNIHITDRGEAGRTPVKGEDYWTEKDIEEIKRDILFDNDFEEITTKDIDLLF